MFNLSIGFLLDTLELSEETKLNIQKSRLEIKQGKIHSFDKVKHELGF